jgi:hypothetical protein
MRSPSAFGSRALQTCAALVLLAGCAVGPSAIDYHRSHDPEAVPTPPSATSAKEPPPEYEQGDSVPPEGGESTGDIIPDRSEADSGTPGALDASSTEPLEDAGPDTTLLSADAGDAATLSKRCLRGSRSLVRLSVPGSVRGTVLMDDTYIYYQNALPNSPLGLRQDIMALPRAVLYDPSLPVTPVVILHDDYALGALTADSDHLYFIAMPQADTTNQGLFRVQKRERVAIESMAAHALPSDDFWPGQLAVDESYFYLASIGESSHALRIVRIARMGYQREELWLDVTASNDSGAPGALTLRQGDIALDRDHVYFTARVQGGATPQFRVYRLNKQGSRQTAQLLTTLDNSFGGLASDGSRLFFGSSSVLEQWDLASSARELLTPEGESEDLRYDDGVISWAPTDTKDGNLEFFCL